MKATVFNCVLGREWMMHCVFCTWRLESSGLKLIGRIMDGSLYACEEFRTWIFFACKDRKHCFHTPSQVYQSLWHFFFQLGKPFAGNGFSEAPCYPEFTVSRCAKVCTRNASFALQLSFSKRFIICHDSGSWSKIPLSKSYRFAKITSFQFGTREV